MKLVEFENGKFGVRLYWFFGWYFRDLQASRNYFWSRKSRWFSECQGNREQAEALLSPKQKFKYQIVPTKKDIIKKEVLVKKKNTAQNPTGKRMIQL